MPLIRLCLIAACALWLLSPKAIAGDKRATALVSWLEQVADDADFGDLTWDETNPGETEPVEVTPDGPPVGMPWVYPNEFELQGLYPLDPVALDEHGAPAYCKSCSRPGCGPMGCGPCGGGCVTPTWFAGVEFTGLHRDSARRFSLGGYNEPLVINDQVILIPVSVLSTKDLDFNLEPGMRLTVGRYLGTDFLKRVHSLEFEYYGLFHYSASAHATGELQTQTNIFGLPVFSVGSLFSFFPQGTQAFTGATVQTAEYSSDFNNWEMNWRVRRPLGRDSLVARPDNSWYRRCTTGLTPSLLMGFRALSVNEQFGFYTQGPRILYNAIGQPVFSEDVSGSYRVRSTNNLFGFQIGGDIVQQFCKFNFGMKVKTGLYSNWSTQTSVVQASEDFIFNDFDPSRAFAAKGQHISFVGDVGFFGNYHVSQNMNLRVGYDMLWVTRLALAPLQIQRQIDSPPRVNVNGGTFFQGVTAGVEFFW